LLNFSNLHATRTVTPGRIVSVTQEELDASLRRSRAVIEEARAGIEVERRRQENAISRQEAAIARHEALIPKHEAEWKEMVRSSRQTDAIIAELKEHRDERRALLEAIFKVMDRLD
jgi:septal ring factor EnvC (AmiA/AmiB activator)